MGKRKRILLIVVVTVFLGWLSWVVWQPPKVNEPIYRGKPYSYWFMQEEQRIEQANGAWITGGVPPYMEATRMLGTNAIPWLLNEASAHDPMPKQILYGLLRWQSVIKIHLMMASDHERRAKWGLSCLGTNAGRALAQGLTNSDKWIRHGCVGQWEVGQKYPEIYVPALIDRLNDPEPIVRARAANAVGMIHQQPEKAVPMLIKLLDDKDQWVRCMAALGLSCYGKDAQAALPVLTKHLTNADPGFEFFATNALKAIGPVTMPVKQIGNTNPQATTR